MLQAYVCPPSHARWSAEVTEMASSTEWGVEILDLAAYLDRINYVGPLDPSATTLRLLHARHVAAISFENLDPVLGRAVSLDLGAVQQKLVDRRRGGYCHEHNLLLAGILERLGFRVTRLLARVHGAHSILPRGHTTLLVEAEGQTWLADVGFGGEGPLEPIPLEAGVTSRQGGWDYRLRHGGDDWLLQIASPAGWVDLYSFVSTVFRQPDFEMANHFVSTHPTSPFATEIIVQRTTGTIRHALRGVELTVTRPDGTREGLRVGRDTLLRLLRHTFGIRLANDDVRRLLAVLAELDPHGQKGAGRGASGVDAPDGGAGTAS